MAANQSEGMQSTETKDAPEEIAGKKKSKFQAFKKLFVKKKRKESPAPSTESKLKPSQSSSDVSASGANTTAFHSADELVARGNMGNKAVSHDSVFISEIENSAKEDISQENTPGKVKALQLQLQQNIRIGSPPQTIVPKKQEDSGALSEDDGLPRSPPEMTSLHEILQQSSGKSPNSDQRRNSLSLGGTDSEDEPEPSESSSHPIGPLCFFPPLDFTSPPISVAFLDYSAAKHRIAVKPKKRRKPNLNMRQTKDATVCSEVLQTKEDDEDARQVDPQHEEPNEQVKFTEDAVIQESEVDVILSLSTLEMDKSKFITENFDTSEVSETSLHEIKRNEAEVNLHGSLLAIEDHVKNTEMKTERQQESSSLAQSSGVQPCLEQGEIAATDEPSKINDAKEESASLDVGHGTAYNTTENVIINLGDKSICGIDGTTVNKVTDEELIHDRAFKHLSEVQNDVPDIIESTLVAIENPQDDFKLDPDPAIMKGQQVKEKGRIDPKCVLLSESIYAENPVTMEVTISEIIPEASDTFISDVEGDQPIINDPPPSEKKVETIDLRITEGNNEQPDVDPESAPAIHTPDSYPMSLASGSLESGADLLFTRESSMECKVTKPADLNSDTKTKASNKPVRFTVAPAWQRALSVGSNAKDSPLCKSTAANKIRSESFDGAESVVDIYCKMSERPPKLAKDGPCVPFGVRLRSTSSSVKYNEEYPEEFSKQGPSSVDTSSMVAARSVQSPTKTSHVHSDFTKTTKSASTSEDRNLSKPKVEEPLPQEITEPAWITMAKLKQKGFQHHLLAKEQSIPNESDNTEVTIECLNKRNNIVTSPQKVEVKTSEVASTDNQAVSEEVQMYPGKNMRSSQPQSPEEPPWFSLAKKKAKAWSEMPQSVQ